MDKKKVIIWGIGSGYYKREAILKEKCEIIAYTGNQKATKEIGLPFIEPNQLAEKEYDEVVICSIPYFYTIKYQLQNYYHIPSYKIGCITDWIIKRDLINEEVEQKIFQSVETYIEKNHNPSFEVKKENMWLICDDLADNAGAINKLYLMQDIWAAKEVYQSGVKEHYDIGSRLDGFLTHLLVFCDRVNYIDIRPLDSKIEGLHFVQADATNLDGIANESISSLSSLHAIEHFGLGRYGDPVDPDACFKAMEAL